MIMSLMPFTNEFMMQMEFDEFIRFNYTDL